MMTLQPGETTGEATENEHAWAEQWCFMVQGEGQARTKGPAYDSDGEPLY